MQSPPTPYRPALMNDGPAIAPLTLPPTPAPAPPHAVAASFSSSPLAAAAALGLSATTPPIDDNTTALPVQTQPRTESHTAPNTNDGSIPYGGSTEGLSSSSSPGEEDRDIVNADTSLGGRGDILETPDIHGTAEYPISPLTTSGDESAALRKLLKAEMSARVAAANRATALALELTKLRASFKDEQNQWFTGTAALRQSISLIAGGGVKKGSRFRRSKKSSADGSGSSSMEGSMQNAQQQAEILRSVVSPMESEIVALKRRLAIEARRTAQAEAMAAAVTASASTAAAQSSASSFAAGGPAAAAVAAKQQEEQHAIELNRALFEFDVPTYQHHPSFFQGKEPKEEQWTSYTKEQCSLIEQAWRGKRGSVRLPGGAFEIRFRQHAVSEKLTTPPATGILQVNLSTQNSRAVRRGTQGVGSGGVGGAGGNGPGPDGSSGSSSGSHGGDGSGRQLVESIPKPPVPSQVRIQQLEHELQLEKSHREDLTIQSRVQVAQRGVLLGELETCRLELERERSAHNDLKFTWSMANDQFLESQRALRDRASSLENQLLAVQEAAGFAAAEFGPDDARDAQLRVAELEEKLAAQQESIIGRLEERDKHHAGRASAVADEYQSAQGLWRRQKQQLVDEIQSQRVQIVTSQKRVSQFAASLKDLTEKSTLTCAFCSDNEYRVLAANDEVAEMSTQCQKAEDEAAQKVESVRDELELATLQHATHLKASLDRLEEQVAKAFDEQLAAAQDELVASFQERLVATEEAHAALAARLAEALKRAEST